MGKKADEIAALREQVEALKAEIALLRAMPVGSPAWPGELTWPYPTAPQCTCQTSVRCQKHYPHDWGTIWVSAQNMCAGAAPVPQTYILNTAGAPAEWKCDIPTNACAPVQTFMVTTGP